MQTVGIWEYGNIFSLLQRFVLFYIHANCRDIGVKPLNDDSDIHMASVTFPYCKAGTTLPTSS